MRLLLLPLLCAALTSVSTAALGQAFPAKPVRWVVPFAAGGPADVVARILAPGLSEALGQPVIIDNRPGGNSNIGHDAVARAAPDGYTILYVVPNVVTNPSLFSAPMVDPIKGFAPVAQLTSQSYVLLAHPSFAPKTMPEIIAKAKQGGVSCASGGGLPTFGCEWLRSMTKADFLHIPYKGNAPALSDLIGGQVNILIDLFNTALPQIRAGTVRPVALTRPSRGQPLPELPVIAETLPGFVLVGWHGVLAPAGTPGPVVERLNAAFARALANEDVKKRINESFLEVTPSTPAGFGRLLQEDFEKYSRIVREAGIKPQ